MTGKRGIRWQPNGSSLERAIVRAIYDISPVVAQLFASVSAARRVSRVKGKVRPALKQLCFGFTRYWPKKNLLRLFFEHFLKVLIWMSPWSRFFNRHQLICFSKVNITCLNLLNFQKVSQTLKFSSFFTSNSTLLEDLIFPLKSEINRLLRVALADYVVIKHTLEHSDVCAK